MLSDGKMRVGALLFSVILHAAGTRALTISHGSALRSSITHPQSSALATAVGSAEDSQCDNLRRRGWIASSSAALALTFCGGVDSALAAEEELGDVHAAFALVRAEVEGGPGMRRIEKAVEGSDWADIKEFTKFYDLEFRKALMGKARKQLSDKAVRDK